ncbi:hypothetical protein N2152v2_008650 [Parachlorella kessleri]
MGDAADVGGSNARTIAAASSQWQRIADAALDRSFCTKGLNTGDCQQVPHSAALALPAASKATTDDRLKASYQAMLLRIKGQHGKELQSLRSQHKQALALQDKLALLAGEFDSRVQVASYEARCKAEEQHQAELQKLRGEWAPLQRECQQLRSGMEGLQAEHSAHVTDALAMQQAQHDAAAVRQEQAHAEAMAALESHYTSLLHQRDGELSQLLMELRAINDEEGGASPPDEPVKLLEVSVSAAPTVDTTGLALLDNRAVPVGDALHLQDAAVRQVKYNLPLEQMHAPVLGPAHPTARRGVAANLRNHRSGHVEDAHLSSFAFDEQYQTFMSYGYAHDPGGQGVVARAEAEPLQTEDTVYTRITAAKRQKIDKGAKEAVPPVDPTQPWTLRARQPWADKVAATVELTEEQKAYMEQVNAEKAEKDVAEGKGDHTMFHGKAEVDYQGRSWIEPPKDRRKESDQCFVPKRHIHTWSGHTKGVNGIRFFPEHGHLLLSAGLDGKVKIWDVYGNKKCMRTYMGHSKGVRDIQFSNDGRRFLSSGYDRIIKLWDTETGKVISSFGEGKMAYCVRFKPDQQNVLMAGTHDKKIMQWDMETGDLVQGWMDGLCEDRWLGNQEHRVSEYDYHLAAVNTITFIDDARRFVSTSDDKTIRVWEFGIPVQVKYIADPEMHAISAVTLHPSTKYWSGQSMDNQIVTYSARDRVKPNRKKTFKGHMVAGYACEVNFSPDGHYVISGDGEGKLFVWDWKTSKIVRSLKAHEGVCIGSAWHPLETSKVATCGWDGLIKYWD